ncbi:MAG: hypothetical protein IPO00_13630 [Betaproteobacteria bacterium]|nr:hypothetical protein [Betaproteobacteria bacterium]
MPQPSRKRSTATSTSRRSRKRLRFIAAVRFANGHRERFSVDNASNHDEARQMVFDELDDVAAVLISDYR